MPISFTLSSAALLTGSWFVLKWQLNRLNLTRYRAAYESRSSSGQTPRQRRLAYLSRCAGDSDPDKVIHYLHKASRAQLQGKHHNPGQQASPRAQARYLKNGLPGPLDQLKQGLSGRIWLYGILSIGLLVGWSQW